jgi:hypothetical protein
MTRLHEVTKQVDAPPESVWLVMADVERWPDWTPTVSSARRLEGGPFRLGSRVMLTQPRLPRATWVVTEIDEGHGFTWESGGPGLRSIARHKIAAAGEGCTVTLSVEQRGPASPLVDLLWGRLTQRYVELEAESLDRRVSATRST